MNISIMFLISIWAIIPDHLYLASRDLPLVFPVMSPTLTSSFGPRVHPLRGFSKEHTGIDLAAPTGSLVRALRQGTVTFADTYSGYGRVVTLKHKGGFTSNYAHLSEILVKPGQKVPAGKVIGRVGQTGSATGPHLHFEWRYLGTPLDPLQALPALNAYK